MAHHALPAGAVDEAGLKPNESSRGDLRFNRRAAAFVVVKVGDPALATGEALHDRAEILFWNLNPESLEGSH